MQISHTKLQAKTSTSSLLKFAKMAQLHKDSVDTFRFSQPEQDLDGDKLALALMQNQTKTSSLPGVTANQVLAKKQTEPLAAPADRMVQAESDGSGLMSRMLLPTLNGVVAGAAVTGAVTLGQYAMQTQGIAQGLAFAGAGLVALPVAASLLIGEGGPSLSQRIVVGVTGVACGAAAAAIGLPVALVAGAAAAGAYFASGSSGN